MSLCPNLRQALDLRERAHNGKALVEPGNSLAAALQAEVLLAGLPDEWLVGAARNDSAIWLTRLIRWWRLSAKPTPPVAGNHAGCFPALAEALAKTKSLS